MRIDASRVFEGVGSKGKIGTSAFTDSLKEGDIVRAEVVSSAKGIVTMKTENGQIFKAKLDAAADFLPGDRVFLEVAGKENDIASLSIVKEGDVLTGMPGKSGAVSGFEDKSLAPFAAKLAELKLPVTEEASRVMRELITQNPNMTLDEAAFLASNKLTGSAGLMNAALALISNGDKTDAMLARLLALLGQSNESGLGESGIDKQSAFSNVATGTPGFAASVAWPGGGQSMLTDWLAQINGGTHGFTEVGDQPQKTPLLTAEPIIAHNDTILQSRNVISYQNILQNDEFFEKQPVFQSQNQQVLISDSSNPEIKAHNSAAIIDHNNLHQSPQAASAIDSAADLSGLAHQLGVNGRQVAAPTDAPDNSQLSTINSQLSALLAELPEFRETPAAALERFSDMLLRVAGDSAEIAKGDTEKLKLMLDKLFTRIEKNDHGAGERLRSAREELFARLSFIEEAIMRASPSAKSEMLDQTQRLMEHVRTLNNIDQFVYMQLPVTLGEERKSAELYMFKKKGRKRADPDNVNILLALDLEHMGHWEALLNIRNKDVSIKMEVSGAAEKDHFSAHTVLLHNMLAEAEFKLVSTDITHSSEKTTPLTALAALDRRTSVKTSVDFFI